MFIAYINLKGVLEELTEDIFCELPKSIYGSRRLSEAFKKKLFSRAF